jgi:hypothetical protein
VAANLVSVTLEQSMIAKVARTFAFRSLNIASVHELFAKPLTLWRIMR